jgi:dihydroflavonol-4-reductase
MSRVLVTGGSGFIGGHLLLQLLGAGYEVRTTVRDLAREPEVRALVAAGGADPGGRLSVVAADLKADDGWDQAVMGCEYVLHVASPLPPTAPKREADLIDPARLGTLRVLRAARDGGIKRVVLTSSFAAIGYGHRPQAAPFTESYWTDPTGTVGAYVKSKTLAERAAWNFIATEGDGLELTAINPVVVLGPVLGPDYSASILLVQRMLEGSIPGCPQLYVGVVDVRDVADLHIRAMTHPAARSQRFLAAAGDFVSLIEVARILRSRLGEAARRVPTRQLPNWLVRMAAWRSATVREILPELGKKKNASSDKARRVLSWTPRPIEECITATAESLRTLVGHSRRV